MSDNLVTAIVSIVLAIIGLASLSVILSPNAQTSNVIKSASGGLATDIQAATGPVTGGGLGGGLSFGGLAAPSLGNGV
jgi:hypothetical protein